MSALTRALTVSELLSVSVLHDRVNRSLAASVMWMPMDFDSFYQENKDSVFRAVVATTGSIGEAEEATAEGFARALTRWPSVSEHPNPAGWVVVTATNYYRSFRRRARRLVALGERVIVAEDRVELESSVDRLRSLPLRQRQAIALCILMDLDSDQAGAALGIAPSTVRVHLHRGLEALRSRMTDEKEVLR